MDGSRLKRVLLFPFQVENPSTPNDEGITPLHNAVCAGHHHIVKFLLDFGVNVNAADSDGWSDARAHATQLAPENVLM